MVVLALWLNAMGRVCAESPRTTIRISIMADGGFFLNGMAASETEVNAALEKLQPDTDVAQIYGARRVPDPTQFRAIYIHGLPAQFGSKADFSDITANTPAMRIVHPDEPGYPKFDFTGCISDICPVHHEKMTIGKVGMFREPQPSLIPLMTKEERNQRYPFRGAAPADIFFMGMADVYVCPTCSREYEASVKKATETPQTTGKWTTYVSLRGVPEELRTAFMTQVPDGSAIADAGEPFAFGCIVSPGEPRRQFAFAGTQGDLGFFIWREGGFAIFTRGATFAKSKDGWKANTIPSRSSPGVSEKYFEVSFSHQDRIQDGYVAAIEAQIAGKR